MNDATMNGYNPKLREACARAGEAEPQQAETDPPVLSPEKLRTSLDIEFQRAQRAIARADARIGEIDEQIATLKAEAKRERAGRAKLRRTAKMLNAAIEADGDEGAAA